VRHAFLSAFVPSFTGFVTLLLRRVHGRYAQYFNVKSGRTGHLWQNRYFACALGPAHIWRALAYVDSNPVRAGMVAWAAEYPWSSAAAHIRGNDPTGLLDLYWWQAQALGPGWQDSLRNAGPNLELEQCTYAGKPFGDAEFVAEIGGRFARKWIRGRPKKKPELVALTSDVQDGLFTD